MKFLLLTLFIICGFHSNTHAQVLDLDNQAYYQRFETAGVEQIVTPDLSVLRRRDFEQAVREVTEESESEVVIIRDPDDQRNSSQQALIRLTDSLRSQGKAFRYLDLPIQEFARHMGERARDWASSIYQRPEAGEIRAAKVAAFRGGVLSTITYFSLGFKELPLVVGAFVAFEYLYSKYQKTVNNAIIGNSERRSSLYQFLNYSVKRFVISYLFIGGIVAMTGGEVFSYETLMIKAASSFFYFTDFNERKMIRDGVIDRNTVARLREFPGLWMIQGIELATLTNMLTLEQGVFTLAAINIGILGMQELYKMVHGFSRKFQSPAFARVRSNIINGWSGLTQRWSEANAFMQQGFSINFDRLQEGFVMARVHLSAVGSNVACALTMALLR